MAKTLERAVQTHKLPKFAAVLQRGLNILPLMTEPAIFARSQARN
jgi:hypothetical protein